MLYVVNAFSLNMLKNADVYTYICDVNMFDVKYRLSNSNWTGAIGHESTARIVSDMIGIPGHKLFGRVNVTLNLGDELIVAQYVGPRLPEGATSLPEGAAIKFMKVRVIDPKEVNEVGPLGY